MYVLYIITSDRMVNVSQLLEDPKSYYFILSCITLVVAVMHEGMK
jgi:hypothetical protein